MHRGSSKGTQGSSPVSETLPLSASPPLVVELEIVRAGHSETRTVRLAPGSSIRTALRAIGAAAEGSAVFDGERSLPLDTIIEHPHRFRVVPTFSGG